jgi:hypothetical protein
MLVKQINTTRTTSVRAEHISTIEVASALWRRLELMETPHADIHALPSRTLAHVKLEWEYERSTH